MISFNIGMEVAKPISLPMSMRPAFRSGTIYHFSNVLEYAIDTRRRSKSETLVSGNIFEEFNVIHYLNERQRCYIAPHSDKLNNLRGPVLLLHGILARFSDYSKKVLCFSGKTRTYF